jgi:hypothetical protein
MERRTVHGTARVARHVEAARLSMAFETNPSVSRR